MVDIVTAAMTHESFPMWRDIYFDGATSVDVEPTTIRLPARFEVPQA